MTISAYSFDTTPSTDKRHYPRKSTNNMLSTKKNNLNQTK